LGMKKKKIIKKNLNFDDKKSFYRGEVLKGKPNGYGILFIYDDNKWAKNILPSQIRSIYLGKWKEGKFSGKGRLVDYTGLEYESDEFGMPTPLEEYKGNFRNGKCSSKIKPNFNNPGEFKFSEIFELIKNGAHGIKNNEDLKNVLKANARFVDRKKFKYNGDINSNVNLLLLESMMRNW